MPKMRGGEVQRLRKELGFSQEELATDAGISRAHLASIETDRREVSSPVARKVARALGLRNPEELIDRG